MIFLFVILDGSVFVQYQNMECKVLKDLKLANVLKPKRTKFAMSYILINIRDSSAVSRATLLQIHSKWEKDL